MPDRNANTGAQVEFVPADGGVVANTGAQVEFVPADGGVIANMSLNVEFIPPIRRRKQPVIQGRTLRQTLAQGARFRQRGGKVLVGDENFGD
jgi:hypothetical protein